MWLSVASKDQKEKPKQAGTGFVCGTLGLMHSCNVSGLSRLFLAAIQRLVGVIPTINMTQSDRAVLWVHQQSTGAFPLFKPSQNDSKTP